MPNDDGHLGGGAWKGRRIVSAAWVKESTVPRIKISPQTTGLSVEDFQNSCFEGEDALAWHHNGLCAGERRHTAHAATGNGGQLLYVVPELELAAVFTGGNYKQGAIWCRWADQLIGEYIVPGSRKGGEK